MDIAALSVGMSQNKLQQDLGISMMKMAMNQMSDQGDALAEMMGDTKSMELAAQPYLGSNVDISA